MTLSDEDFSRLISMGEVRTYDKKFRITDIDEQEPYVHFIVKGLARKYFIKGKDELITQLAREGDVINSSVSFLAGTPSVYIIETIEPTTCLSYTRETIDQLYAEDIRWQRLGRMILTDLFLSKEKWELEQAMYTTRQRFQRFLDEYPDLFYRVPQKYLASFLNIQPETFSRLKNGWRAGSYKKEIAGL
jgi:CRP-like cAMP-binding protein